MSNSLLYGGNKLFILLYVDNPVIIVFVALKGDRAFVSSSNHGEYGCAVDKIPTLITVWQANIGVSFKNGHTQRIILPFRMICASTRLDNSVADTIYNFYCFTNANTMLHLKLKSIITIPSINVKCVYICVIALLVKLPEL